MSLCIYPDVYFVPMQNRKSCVTEQRILDIETCDKDLISSLGQYFVLYFICIFTELLLLVSMKTIANQSGESIVLI